jgi:hypothetical protein
MTAIIHHEARHDHLALVFAERDRRGMWKPTPFTFSPRGISAFGQDRDSGLEAQPASPSRRARHTLFGGTPNAK